MTPTLVSVTLPVFFTTNVYGRVAPAAKPVSMPADFTSEIAGVRVIVVLVESVDVTAAPEGGMPATLAVLFTPPESTSVCVSVKTFVHVVDALGSSVVTVQVTGPTLTSVTPIEVSVTLPELVMTKL
jgi:hypothetical protein